MLHGARQLEVFREVVLPVHAKHGFTLLAIIVVAFERHVDGGARINNAVGQDGNLARIIVDTIVRVFGQRNTASRYHYRTLWHVALTQRDDIGGRAFKLSANDIFILFGYLLCHGLGRVVQLGKGILGGLVGRYATARHILVDGAAEGLGGGEEHAAVLHGVALNKVEVAVGVSTQVVVEAVGT